MLKNSMCRTENSDVLCLENLQKANKASHIRCTSVAYRAYTTEKKTSLQALLGLFARISS